jgi:hypothetical protein
MVDTPRPGPLAKFQDSIGVVTTVKMKPTGRADKPEQNPSSEIGGHLQKVGWISRQKSSRPPVEEELFS